MHQPWDGAPLGGRTILLHADRGTGEALRFIRYAPLVKARGGTVVVVCGPALVSLLARCAGVDRVVTEGGGVPEGATVASLSSLPRILGANEPAEVPYLYADRARIGRPDALLVGLAWPERELSQFEPVSRMAGVQLVALPAGGELLEAAGLVKAMDLVIGGDDALVDLAGGLGVPVWAVVAPETQASPWYPTLRVFRFEQIARALVATAGARSLVAEALRSHRAGRLDEAERLYRKAIGLDVHQADALHLLGVLLHQRGQHDGALELIARAVAARPDNAAFHCSRGVVLRAVGESRAAADSYRAAVRFGPELFEAHLNLGNVLKILGQLDAAVASYREAARLRPESREAHQYLAIALAESGGAFLSRYQQSLRQTLARNSPELTAGLADAVNAYREAVRLAPADAGAAHGLGATLVELGNLEEAASCFSTAISLRPEFVDAHVHLAVVRAMQGRWNEVERHCDRALEVDPDHADAHAYRGMHLLLTGDFARGWPEYEWRSRNRRPQWDGSSLDGRTLLIRTEQGLGDTLHFVRYVGEIKDRYPASQIAIECRPVLVPLLERCPHIDRLVPQGGGLPPYDAEVPLMSLPRILMTRLESVPRTVPYLFADERKVEIWRKRLRPGDPVVGLVWQGSVSHAGDMHRSIALSRFAPLAAVEGVRLISLQNGPGCEQLAQAGFRIEDAGTGSLVELAALMKAVDLVISVDTAPAHLAGGLGVPVWVLLPFSPDWRWLLDRTDSPWYPSMRLYRQAARGDWDGVIERVTSDLAARWAK